MWILEDYEDKEAKKDEKEKDESSDDSYEEDDNDFKDDQMDSGGEPCQVISAAMRPRVWKKLRNNLHSRL